MPKSALPSLQQLSPRAAKLPSPRPSPRREEADYLITLARCGGLPTFVAAANMLHAALDGLSSTEEVATILASRSSDRTWLLAIATALRELGRLIESGAEQARG